VRRCGEDGESEGGRWQSRGLRGLEEPGLFWRYGLWLIGCGFIGLVLLSTTADLDLQLSGYFYDPAAPRDGF